jgi:hypothetical protein
VVDISCDWSSTRVATATLKAGSARAAVSVQTCLSRPQTSSLFAAPASSSTSDHSRSTRTRVPLCGLGLARILLICTVDSSPIAILISLSRCFGFSG